MTIYSTNYYNVGSIIRFPVRSPNGYGRAFDRFGMPTPLEKKSFRVARFDRIEGSNCVQYTLEPLQTLQASKRA